MVTRLKRKMRRTAVHPCTWRSTLPAADRIPITMDVRLVRSKSFSVISSIRHKRYWNHTVCDEIPAASLAPDMIIFLQKPPISDGWLATTSSNASGPTARQMACSACSVNNLWKCARQSKLPIGQDASTAWMLLKYSGHWPSSFSQPSLCKNIRPFSLPQK